MSSDSLEWQCAAGSRVLHLVDVTKPQWHNPDGSRRRGGPRSECGRYPQRNAEAPWFRLRASVMPRAPVPYGLTRCRDCDDLIGGAA